MKRPPSGGLFAGGGCTSGLLRSLAAAIVSLRKRFERASVGKRHAHIEPAVTPIPQRVVHELHFVPAGNRLEAPAAPSEPARAHTLEPVLFDLAVLAGNHHPQKGVRLSPFPLVDRAVDRLLFAPL